MINSATSGRAIVFVLFAALTSACGPSTTETPTPAAVESADDRVRLIADGYVAAMLERFPEVRTIYGLEGRQDRLMDNSLAALKIWRAREDSWLAQLRKLQNEITLNNAEWATFGLLLGTLESEAAMRVCHLEYWPVSQMEGWQVTVPYLFEIQAIETVDEQEQVLARLRTLPQYIDTEAKNAQLGQMKGYSSPKRNVKIVIDEVRGLMKDDSPLLSPAERSSVSSFSREYKKAFENNVIPALKQYVAFLEDEYLPKARDIIAITQLPDGEECYPIAISYYATVARDPNEIHQLGLEQIAGIEAEMAQISERSFDGIAVPDLIRMLTTDPAYAFESRQAVIDYGADALAIANELMPSWFGIMPKADVEIRPYPAYREASGTGEYQSSSEDGSRPGIYYIPVRNPQERPRAGQQSLAYHETIPGHHLQGAIQLERGDAIHPIARYLWNSGYGEGWALYSERLADEMGMYTDDVDRMGMLGDQAARAARLVIDTGIHSMGWSRQQAIDYMAAHTTWPVGDIPAEIDRYIIWPGQANSYMLGMLEIRRLRDYAEQELGESYSVKDFHDRVLEDGAITLEMLDTKIRYWVESSKSESGDSAAGRD